MRSSLRPLAVLVLFSAILPVMIPAQEKKLALIIGNADYRSVVKLSNPGNDARDMAAVLKDLGFDTTVLVDADLAAMEKARRNFSARSTSATVRLFFYAGHGVQYDGVNWLLPVDADVKEDYELKTEAFSAQALLDGLEASGAGVNIVILDACRDNPFKASSRSAGGSRGLAVMGISGSLIAYATAPGQTAADGSGRNGVFTEALLGELATPGRSVQEIMTSVTARVNEATKGSQTPWTNASLPRMVYFVNPEEAKARFASRIAEGEAALKAAESELAALRAKADREADAAKRQALEIEIQKKAALEAQRKQETAALKAERERQESAAKSQAQEAAQLAGFKADQVSREEAIRKAAEAKRRELERIRSGSGGVTAQILAFEAARSARTEIETQYAESLVKISASVAETYDGKLKALSAWTMDPWENEREFKARVGAERSRLESAKKAALDDAKSKSDADRKEASGPFLEAETSALSGLESGVTAYKGSAVTVEVGEFDRDGKRFPVTISSAVPELVYKETVYYSVKSDDSEKLKKQYREFDAWTKAGALFGEIEAVVMPAGEKEGAPVFVNLVRALRLRAADSSGDRILYEDKTIKPVSFFSGSADRERAKSVTSVLIVTAEGYILSWNTEKAYREDRLVLFDVPAGKIKIRIARKPREEKVKVFYYIPVQEIEISGTGLQRVTYKTRGNLQVRTDKEGELFVDDVPQGKLVPGKPVIVKDLQTSMEHVLELRYADKTVDQVKQDISFNSDRVIPIAFIDASAMVAVKGGTFQRGSPKSEPERKEDEAPFSVRVSSFHISRYEVTVGEFERFIEDTGYKTTAERDGGGDVWSGWASEWKKDPEASWRQAVSKRSYPVVMVSWYDCAEYCNWRSKKEGLKPCYTIKGDQVSCDFKANGYRLPTEAEWEYACRGGTTTATAFGDTLTSTQAGIHYKFPYNTTEIGRESRYSEPAGLRDPNAWGLYDMHGSVWEWCWDWYGVYPAVSGITNPLGAASGVKRVLRGGSWASGGVSARSAARNSSVPTTRSNLLGFRVVRRP